MTTVTVEPDFQIHSLDIIAVQLNGMRVRILTATHRMEYYPVQVEAECFKPKRRSPPIGFAGMENVRFRAPVVPGDRLVLVAKGLKINRRQMHFNVQGFVKNVMVFHGDVIGLPLSRKAEA